MSKRETKTIRHNSGVRMKHCSFFAMNLRHEEKGVVYASFCHYRISATVFVERVYGLLFFVLSSSEWAEINIENYNCIQFRCMQCSHDFHLAQRKAILEFSHPLPTDFPFPVFAVVVAIGIGIFNECIHSLQFAVRPSRKKKR